MIWPHPPWYEETNMSDKNHKAEEHGSKRKKITLRNPNSGAEMTVSEAEVIEAHDRLVSAGWQRVDKDGNALGTLYDQE